MTLNCDTMFHIHIIIYLAIMKKIRRSTSLDFEAGLGLLRPVDCGRNKKITATSYIGCSCDFYFYTVVSLMKGTRRSMIMLLARPWSPCEYAPGKNDCPKCLRPSCSATVIRKMKRLHTVGRAQASYS